MLHEPSVARIRRREKVTQAKTPWTEAVEEYDERLRSIRRYINDKFDVENLCHEFPCRQVRNPPDILPLPPRASRWQELSNLAFPFTP